MPDCSTFEPTARRSFASVALLALLLTFCAGPPGDAPVATIKVSSATSGSHLGGRLVEGLMSFRGNEYILTLRGVEESAQSVGSVRGLLRARDIEGFFKPSDQGLSNASGVTILFDPPLVLGPNGLEIEVASRRSPKVSTGHRESGVE
jgi:hypothetical protein